MRAHHNALLAELSELGMSLARKVHGQAMEADDPAEVRELGLAFQRISRSARQTMALQAKLERDHNRDLREQLDHEVRQRKQRIDLRVARLRAAVSRLIWTEAEGDEAEAVAYDLDDRLDAEALEDTFLDEAIEAQIERLCAELGVRPPSDAASASGPFSHVGRRWQAKPDG